jgi:hypothetical protein
MVGGAVPISTVEKSFGLIVLAAAIAARSVTTVKAVHSFIMGYFLFADMKILLPRLWGCELKPRDGRLRLCGCRGREIGHAMAY